jgi:ribonuclease HI
VAHLLLFSWRENTHALKIHPRIKNITQEELGGVVGWFDGAAASSGLNNGVGGVIRINEICSYKWFLNYGSGTNTRVELLGAWALLTLANRLSLKTIHIMGHSKIIIDWILGKGQLQVLSLDCWKDSITELITTFQNISFDHVYKVENQAPDSLSKLAPTREPGKLTYFQCIEENEGPHLSLDLFWISWCFFTLLSRLYVG